MWLQLTLCPRAIHLQITSFHLLELFLEIRLTGDDMKEKKLASFSSRPRLLPWKVMKITLPIDLYGLYIDRQGQVAASSLPPIEQMKSWDDFRGFDSRWTLGLWQIAYETSYNGIVWLFWNWRNVRHPQLGDIGCDVMHSLWECQSKLLKLKTFSNKGGYRIHLSSNNTPISRVLNRRTYNCIRCISHPVQALQPAAKVLHVLLQDLDGVGSVSEQGEGNKSIFIIFPLKKICSWQPSPITLMASNLFMRGLQKGSFAQSFKDLVVLQGCHESSAKAPARWESREPFWYHL